MKPADVETLMAAAHLRVFAERPPGAWEFEEARQRLVEVAGNVAGVGRLTKGNRRHVAERAAGYAELLARGRAI